MNIAVREFKSAREQVAFYHALKARQSPRPVLRVIAPPVPVIVSRALYPLPIGPINRDYLWVATRPPEAEAPKITGRQILEQVSNKYQIPVDFITSPRRGSVLMAPRFEAAYRMRMETKLSMPQIGKILERDHTTVLHAIKKYTARLASGEVTL